MAGGTANVWKVIDIRLDPDPFHKSCQISSINNNSRSKSSLNPNTPFKWVLMETKPAISHKILAKETNLDIYLLIVDDYSKIPIIYGMENITTKEVMDKLDMFQAKFGKVAEFGW